MATRQADSAGASSALARWLQFAHSVLTWMLIAGVSGLVSLFALSLVQSKSDLIGPYYLQIQLVITLNGLLMTVLGVVRLGMADLDVLVPSLRWATAARQSKHGYPHIIMGLIMFGYGLYPFVTASQPDIAYVVFPLAVFFLIVPLAVAQWITTLRSQSADNTDDAQVRQAKGISRRTVLAGIGTLGAVSVGIGWLIRSLPTFLPRFTYRGHGEHVQAIAWSPDGRRIASSDEGGSVQIWDALTGNAAAHVSIPPSGATSLSWAPDSRRVVAGSDDGTTRVLDGTTGRTVLTYPGNVPSDSARSGAVAWSPTGTYVASVEDDSVHIWDVHMGATHLVVGQSSSNVLAWSPDGERIVIANYGSPVTIWDIRTGKSVIELPIALTTVFALAWSPDGTRIVVAGGYGAQVFDASTGELGTFFIGQHGTVSAVAWSPNSRYIVSASFDNTVEIWEAETGRARFVWRGHFLGASAVAWSPDGAYIASGGWDTTVQVWQPQLG